jgi:hypothetical protein
LALNRGSFEDSALLKKPEEGLVVDIGDAEPVFEIVHRQLVLDDLRAFRAAVVCVYGVRGGHGGLRQGWGGVNTEGDGEREASAVV